MNLTGKEKIAYGLGAVGKESDRQQGGTERERKNGTYTHAQWRTSGTYAFGAAEATFR